MNDPEVTFPILKEMDSGDLTFYDAIASLVMDVEPPEVRSNTYMVMDSRGRLGRLSVTRPPQSVFDRVAFDMPAGTPESPTNLRAVLHEYLLSRGQPQGDGVATEDLLRLARRESEEVKKKSTPWYLR